MEYPPDWEIFDGDEFTTATPRDPGELGLEVKVQVRTNGRMLDHYQLGLGGSRPLDVTVNCSRILPSPNLNKWKFARQYWPRDIAIRRNTTTSKWEDLAEMLARREATITDEAGNEVAEGEVLEFLAALPADQPKSAAMRWAVVVGEDGRPRLDLQSLPAPANTLIGKPALNG